MRKELTKITENIEDYSEFDNHKFVTIINDEKSQLAGFVAIHRKNKDVPSFGATRLWTYGSKEKALRDALRLSRLMSYKAALAGLPCGGAKAVIFQPQDEFDRKKLLRAYAEQVDFLNGKFITGTDVGLSQEDIEYMKEFSSNLVGFNGNATEATARGLLEGIKTSLKYKFNSTDIQGRSFAIQGLGKVGSGILDLLYNEASIIYVSDINEDTARAIQKKYPKVSVVMPEKIHMQSVDVFCPCALSHSLTSKTINELNCAIVAGAANNQLQNDDVGDSLDKLGVLYAPDYVVNAGGLMAVYDEYEHGLSGLSNLTDRIKSIGTKLTTILTESTKTGTPTHRIANKQAEDIFNTYE